MLTEDQMKRTEALLPKKEIIDFPQYNFKVELNYNDLNDDQLCRAKQEIINAAHGFKEAFGHKELNLINKGMKEKSPNNIREFPIFIYDNRDDFVKYTGSQAIGITFIVPQVICNGKACINNVTTTAFLYKHDPQGIGFIYTLLHEFGHQLTYYIGEAVNLSLIIKEGVANYIMYYPHGDRIQFDSGVFTDDRLKSLKNSKIMTGEEYSNELHIFMSFLEEKYHKVLNEILLNKWGNYDNALDFFKAKFPNMVSHIPKSEMGFYKTHDKELLNKILENPKVRQAYLDFFSDKIAENKYISKVIDKNVLMIIRGDHIGTDKVTDEEYYTGMIVRCEKIAALDASRKRIEPIVSEVIDAFSPMEYSYSSNEIKVFNHATKDSIIIPKEYHNLKLVKVDCNFKLAFCDKGGKEYRNTTECKNKTKDLIYTDNAQEAFTLVDLYSIKGITGEEENLNKVVFSLKPINSNSKSISVYDGNKSIGSFTNEVGYTNRGEFHFKGGCSTEFKVYDKNRALIIKEDEGNGEYQTFLMDGNYIDDDNKFQASRVELNGNNVDCVYSQDWEDDDDTEDDDDIIEPINPNQDNNLPSETEQNHERKIIAHLDSKDRTYINTLDILKATNPEVFDENWNFKYLDKIYDIKIIMDMKLKDADNYFYNNIFYDDIDYNNSHCVHKRIVKMFPCPSSPAVTHIAISNWDGKQWNDKQKNGQPWSGEQCDLKKLFINNNDERIYLNKGLKADDNGLIFYVHELDPLRITNKTTGEIIFKGVQDSYDIPVYAVQDIEDDDDTEGNFMIEKGDYIGIDKHTREKCYQAEIIDDNDNMHSTISPMLYLYFLGGIRIFNQATNDSIYITKGYHFLKPVKINNEFKLTFCDKNGTEYRDAPQYKKSVAELVNAADAFKKFALIDSQSIEEIVDLKQHHKNILSLRPATKNGNQAFKLIDIFNGDKQIGSFTNKVGYCKDNKFYFENISTGVKITGEDLDEFSFQDLDEFSFQDLDHVQQPDNMQHEVSNIQYYMINNRIIIYDSELNKRVVIPNKFSYLKLVENANGEYKFALCNEKGEECPNDQCGKYKYIDTEAIKDGAKSFNFKDLCDKKCIFSILPNDTNPQTIKILDNNEKEIGILSNYINEDNNNNPSPDQDNHLPSETEQNHERKIIAYLDSKDRTYINTLDILKATNPEVFDENWNFKYLDELDNAYIMMYVKLKDANKNPYDNSFYDGIDDSNDNCVDKISTRNHYSNDITTIGIAIHSRNQQCDIKKLFTEDGYSKISFKEVPKFIHEGYPLRIANKTTHEIIFNGVQDSDDIPVYAVQDSNDIPAYASHDYLF